MPHGPDFMAEHPRWRGRSLESLRHTYPCAIHLDAVPYTKTSSTNALSWSSVLAMGVSHAKFVCACHIKQAGHRTPPNDRAWLMILRDFHDASNGLDYLGEPLLDDKKVQKELVLVFGKTTWTRAARVTQARACPMASARLDVTAS